MGKATLVVMAAGIGSRFGGGIKQLAPVGPSGEIIMDYSIYDAMEAGFDKVVFVIRKDLEEDFKEVIKRGVRKINYYTYMSKAGGSAISGKEYAQFHDALLDAKKAMCADVKKAIDVFSEI